MSVSSGLDYSDQFPESPWGLDVAAVSTTIVGLSPVPRAQVLDTCWLDGLSCGTVSSHLKVSTVRLSFLLIDGGRR